MVGLDTMVGSITAGKNADFTVLNRDPYVGGGAKLQEVGVKGVVFEGRWFPAE